MREFIVSLMVLGILYLCFCYYLIVILREGGFRVSTLAWFAGRELNDDGFVVIFDV